MIREWAERLAKPTAYNNGVAACPFALPAIEAGEVKTIFTDDLWGDVLKETSWFEEGEYKASLLFDFTYGGSYSELEQHCTLFNDLFTAAGKDLWLLAYLDREAIVFVQRWSDLENAAAKLEKLGYYKNYGLKEYKRHILGRRQRSIENAGQEEKFPRPE